jgi:predicted Zn finger-like uncharacterized protein
MERYCGCPYCEAVFRAPDKKLKQREGMVRCGACREVFDSNVNMMKKTEHGFELIVLGEDILKEFETNVVTEIGKPGYRENLQSPDLPKAPRDSGQFSDASNHAGSGNNDGQDAISLQPNSGLLQSGNTFSEFEPDTIENPFADRGEHTNILSGIEQDESSQQDQEIGLQDSEQPELEDKLNHGKFREPVFEALDTENEQSSEPGLGLVAQDERLDARRIDSDQIDPDDEESTSFNIEGYEFIDLESGRSGEGDSVLSDISADSVPQSVSSNGGNLGRMTRNGVDEYISDRPNPLLSITWFLVALGFIFLLGMQAKYFFVERYAQDETYRKYLIGFCKIARCELAPRKDPFRYTLTHTKIDLHPTHPGALRVTVKMVNEADFAQPYPHLQLTLTDRVGRVVGRRTFPPDFYLPNGAYNMVGEGELASVLFDLARPHEKAVGFVVEIVTEPVAPS